MWQDTPFPPNQNQSGTILNVCPPLSLFPGPVQPCRGLQGTLSLNAAIFAAVLLASRLESNEKVFGLVLFALELFAFFPLARYAYDTTPIVVPVEGCMSLTGRPV